MVISRNLYHSPFG